MNETAAFEKRAYASLMDHVREAYPLEGCGILLSDGKSGLIEEIKSIENAAAELSGLHFAMDPFKLYKIESEAEAEGKVIVGFYHSHPDRQAILSEKDKEYMIPQMLYIVVSTGREGIGGIKGYVKKEIGSSILEVSIREV